MHIYHLVCEEPSQIGIEEAIVIASSLEEAINVMLCYHHSTKESWTGEEIGVYTGSLKESQELLSSQDMTYFVGL